MAKKVSDAYPAYIELTPESEEEASRGGVVSRRCESAMLYER
jgi:hypothetical protein